MWAIDRSDLIILGVALGVLTLVGLTLLFSPAGQLAPVSPSNPTVGISQPTPAPVQAEPVAEIVTPVPEPAPAPVPVSVAADEISSSTPIVDWIILCCVIARPQITYTVIAWVCLLLLECFL